MLHIPNVQRKLVFPADGVEAVYLGPASDAGAHLMPAGLLWGLQRQVLHQQWARAHRTNVALEHVPQLGQFV